MKTLLKVMTVLSCISFGIFSIFSVTLQFKTFTTNALCTGTFFLALLLLSLFIGNMKKKENDVSSPVTIVNLNQLAFPLTLTIIFSFFSLYTVSQSMSHLIDPKLNLFDLQFGNLYKGIIVLALLLTSVIALPLLGIFLGRRVIN